MILRYFILLMASLAPLAAAQDNSVGNRVQNSSISADQEDSPKLGCNDCEGGRRGRRGPVGATGPGATGPGTLGVTGPTGPAGATGGVSAFADFFALMPGDNTATVASNVAVAFPQNGPIGGGTISRLSPSTFNLAAIGTYEVNWQASITENGQLGLRLNGTTLGYTVIGQATGTNQYIGLCLVTTSTTNSILEVINASQTNPPLTITPLAGGDQSVSAHLVIKQLQ